MQQDDWKQDASQELNDLCNKLFDAWCDRRHVIALAYLMHGWPLHSKSDELAKEKIYGALTHLRTFHAESLSRTEHELIGRLLRSEVASDACIRHVDKRGAGQTAPT